MTAPATAAPVAPGVTVHEPMRCTDTDRGHRPHPWTHRDRFGEVPAYCDGRPVPVERETPCDCTDPLCPCSPKPGHGAYAAPVVTFSNYRPTTRLPF